jgi:hypothetical protein
MVMSSFDQVPAAGVVHKTCRHLVDSLVARTGDPTGDRPGSAGSAGVRTVHWCTSHAESAGLMCPDDAQRHEADAHHGDASFTTTAPMAMAIEVADEDGRRAVIDPGAVTIALMVFYAD